MKVHSQPHGAATVLVPHGPLVSEETVDLRRAVDTVESAGARRTVIDMSDIPYLDSEGIELLVEMCGLQVSASRRPKLSALSETCRDALELTETLVQLEVFDTVENALRSCQR